MEEVPKPETETEERSMVDIYSEIKRISELLGKAEVIPDSHWNKKDVAEAFEALRSVSNFLEENIGSGDF